ncbi:hypothetical protein [Sphingomonas sp. BK235]|uniref:Bbp19 family protein n=1 Tax=Sphingomonas sp. BK235 TaxID=2512131 RepID=UPI00104BB808|nr:hypothetical protein [Sphingomonas sp. BK235]TCP35907.1 hypothetical protein EV292_102497 [Sphingomonas sp. BK235]
MSAAERNRLRWRAVGIARAVKELFAAGERVRGWRAAVARALLGRAPRAWLYRAVLLADGLVLRVAAERVLADLRDFTFAARPAFDPDPLVMARREGRRDVWLRLTNYLHPDERQVRLLMESDDGD